MKQRGFTIVEAVFAIVAIAGIGGWIANIVKLVGSEFVMSGMLIARAIGIIVAPLGAVLGYL